MQIAAAFLNRLGLREIYVAYLDAIRNPVGSVHRRLIETLAHRTECDIILDAGISDVESVIDRLKSGVHKIVLGSETLTSLEALKEITETVDAGDIIFSLDCYNGKILTKCPELAAFPPIKALNRIRSCGLKEIILLELDRVGSGYGANFSFAAKAAREFPDCTLIAGGGIRSLEEIKELQSLGIEGVLVATVLHQGIIGSQHLSRLHE